jgi:hypothetical protein
MAKTASTTPAPAEKKKRTILTPEQKLAKMEVELQAARDAIKAKAEAKLDAKRAELHKATEQVTKAQAKRDTIEAELDALLKQAGVEAEAETTES